VDLQRKYNGQIGFSVSDDDVFYDTDFKNMKSKNTLLKSLNYNIGFSDVNRDSLNRIVRLEMDKFEFELKNSGIMVEYEESIFTLFSSYDGTPSEIRSRIRETLELSISEKITRNRKTYRFAVIGNNVKIVEEKEFESSTIQSS
jgi:ATP-dependent Clp protease ATP-binding subunit ClpA